MFCERQVMTGNVLVYDRWWCYHFYCTAYCTFHYFCMLWVALLNVLYERVQIAVPVVSGGYCNI